MNDIFENLKDYLLQEYLMVPYYYKDDILMKYQIIIDNNNVMLLIIIDAEDDTKLCIYNNLYRKRLLSQSFLNYIATDDINKMKLHLSKIINSV